MNTIYVPTESAEQWKQFLAEPEKQWRKGFSARTLAYAWQEADGFPSDVHAILSASPHFRDIKLLLAIPEHQVPLPGGSRPSQSDIWVLARAGSALISIAVEGKVSEPFGPTIHEWCADASLGKTERLDFLCAELGLVAPPPDGLRYQLLHRAASAVIEARRFAAAHAIMLVHSFCQSDKWFKDFADFVSLFGGAAAVDTLVSIGTRNGVSLHFAWVRGGERFLAM